VADDCLPPKFVQICKEKVDCDHARWLVMYFIPLEWILFFKRIFYKISVHLNIWTSFFNPVIIYNDALVSTLSFLGAPRFESSCKPFWVLCVQVVPWNRS
jgi:hypothetical protein